MQLDQIEVVGFKTLEAAMQSSQTTGPYTCNCRYLATALKHLLVSWLKEISAGFRKLVDGTPVVVLEVARSDVMFFIDSE